MNPSRTFIAILLAATFLTLIPAPDAHAQTSVELMVRPLPSNFPAEARLDAFFLSSGQSDRDEEFGGNPADRDYTLSIYDFKGRFRLAPEAKVDPRLGLAATYMLLNAQDLALPDQLLDASAAIGFGVFERGGWVGALTLGYGYAGAADEIFGDSNAWYPKASLVIGKKFSRTDTLAILIDYDANRTYKPDVPLPGIIWQKLIFGRPDDEDQSGAKPEMIPGVGPPREQAGQFEPRLLLTLGLPYTNINYRPTHRLTLDATYLMPDDFSARIDFDLLGNRQLGLYASFDTRRNAFHWDALADGDDRILYFQRRAELGLRWTPAQRQNYSFNVLAAIGYAFSQELTIGFDSTDDDKLAELSDQPYLRFGVELGF